MATQPLTRELAWLIRDKYPDFFRRRAWRPQFRALLKDVARLRAGEPLAYVIGWTPFLGAKIDLRFRPLIPRTETEYWTECAIRESARGPIRCLDLFAGSGCIGIAVLCHLPDAHVTFADINPDALRQIRLNLKLNGIPHTRCRIVRSDTWRAIPQRFDLVFANPPYIPVGRKLPRSVAAFEPRGALHAGEDGLAVIRRFLRGLGSHLAAQGRAYLEFDMAQKKMLGPLARQAGLQADLRRDQFGKMRWAEIHSRA